MAEKNRKNKKLLVMENTNKIIIAENAKVSSTIDFRNKHS